MRHIGFHLPSGCTLGVERERLAVGSPAAEVRQLLLTRPGSACQPVWGDCPTPWVGWVGSGRLEGVRTNTPVPHTAAVQLELRAEAGCVRAVDFQHNGHGESWTSRYGCSCCKGSEQFGGHACRNLPTTLLHLPCIPADGLCGQVSSFGQLARAPQVHCPSSMCLLIPCVAHCHAMPKCCSQARSPCAVAWCTWWAEVRRW